MTSSRPRRAPSGSAARSPSPKAGKGSTGGKSGGGPVCAICHKPLRRHQPQARTSTGKTAHKACLDRAIRAGQGKSAKKQTSKTAAKANGGGDVDGGSGGRVAKYAGTCPECHQPYPSGTKVRQHRSGSWGHASCMPSEVTEFARNKARIEAGETFRSQKASDWRRGRGPGSSRSTR